MTNSADDISRSRHARWADWLPIAVGAALRCLSLVQNRGFCHGDLNIDSSIAESLAHGKGFWVPFEDASVFVADPLGDTLATFGHPADSHGPLWPMLAAPFVWIVKDGYLACQILSFLCGLLTIFAAGRVFRNFLAGEAGEWAGRAAAWACALSLPLCDYAGGGSLYAGEICVVTLLPLVASSLDTRRGALAAGAALGASYLLAYQNALLIPLFALGAFACFGFRAACTNLMIAGAACLAVTAPWFIRNYVVFGDPLYSTNAVFFAAKVGNTFVDFRSGPRPLLVSSADPEHVSDSLLGWIRANLPLILAAIATVAPVFGWFAAGGLQRACRRALPGRVRLSGYLISFGLAVLVLTAAICPLPRTRYFVPMAPLLLGAGALELAGGLRWKALAAGLVLSFGSALYLYYELPSVYGPLFRDALPSAAAMLVVVPLAFVARTRAAAVPVALSLLFMIGAHRAYVACDLGRLRDAYPEVSPADAALFRATPTFYDFVNEPFTEGATLAIRDDAQRASAALKAAGCTTLYAEAGYSTFWDDRFLSSRGRVEWPQLAPLLDYYKPGGLFIQEKILSREPAMQKTLQKFHAREVYRGPVFCAFTLNP